MSQQTDNIRLELIRSVASYCAAMERADDMERHEFLETVTRTLPRIYLFFITLTPEPEAVPMFSRMADYVDEDYYNAIRLKAEMQMGPDDTFLDTFQEDMKYSDTPIAASVSESLADIFQPLYNFLNAVRDADEAIYVTALMECKETFDEYWSQTLVNVMRPLNHLIFHPSDTNL